jgi:hypothetical protein
MYTFDDNRMGGYDGMEEQGVNPLSAKDPRTPLTKIHANRKSLSDRSAVVSFAVQE